MAEIKLYLDEDVFPTIAVVLRSRGYDAVSAHEVEMKGKKDGEQLDYARQEERVLLTFNARHFAPLAEEYYQKGREHSGIVISRKANISEMVRLIANMLKKANAEDLKNSLIWLQNFRMEREGK